MFLNYSVKILLNLSLLIFPLLVGAEYKPNMPLALPEEVGFSSPRMRRIDSRFSTLVQNGRFPGFVTAVMRHGKVAHFSAHGYSDVESRTSMRADSIFRIYSMTKPIVGVGMMILYEQGHFQLDDPVSKFIPEFSAMKVYTAEGLVEQESPITIRHLMTHTSGLADAYMSDPVSQQYKHAGLDAEWSTMMSGITLREYVQKITDRPLLFQPGSQWHYGMNITVLGRLIEIISGQTLSRYLEDHILSPLKLNDTGYFVPSGKHNRLVPLYKIKDHNLINITQESAYEKKPSLEMGDSGMVSTAPDMLRFLQMLLNGGVLDGVRILSPGTVKLMRSNHLPERMGEMPLRQLKDYYPLAARRGTGQGLTMAVITDAVAAGSTGSNGEYTWGGAACTDFWVDPETKVVGLVFTQLSLCWNYHDSRMLMHQLTYQALVNRDHFTEE